MPDAAEVVPQHALELQAVKPLRLAVILGIAGFCLLGCAFLPHLMVAVINATGYRDYLTAEKWQYGLTAAGWALIAAAFIVSSTSLTAKSFRRAAVIGGIASSILAAASLILWIFSEFGITLTELEARIIASSSYALSIVGWVIFAVGIGITLTRPNAGGELGSLE